MAHRTFRDTGGREWEVWDVFPHHANRRLTADRRVSEVADRRSQIDRQDQGDRRQIERRAGSDRREEPRWLLRLPRTHFDGWLCFECGDEKRRLVPVPPGWERLSDDELTHLLESAPIAHAR